MLGLASYIEHTSLKPVTSITDIVLLCEEAKMWGFAAVCVPPPYVGLCKNLLSPSATKVATVVGFPFGYSCTEAKLAEIVKAIEAGVDELDLVHNLSALKNEDWKFLEQEMRLLTESAHFYKKVLKVILETSELSENEIINCCRLYSQIGVDFIKTSTGYASAGASVAQISLIKAHVPKQMGIKASGGIKDRLTAEALLSAGATRLGCSSSVSIMETSL